MGLVGFTFDLDFYGLGTGVIGSFGGGFICSDL